MVGREIDKELVAPTYIRTSDFTAVGQMLVDNYEIPAYKELNPGVLTVVSFPFLFAVMFGDIFSGSLLLAAGIYATMMPRTKGSIAETMAPMRYTLLLMGIFSLFSGFMYNDFSSCPIYLFGSSCFELPESGLGPSVLKEDCVYLIGVDPSWYIGTNELLFMNSLKMKLALIFGVLHILLGVILRGFNSLYFREWLNILFEFIPMMVMFTATMVYMISMIFSKWLTSYEGEVVLSGGEEVPKTSVAPAILQLMLQMAMSNGKPANPNTLPLYGTQQFETTLMQNLLLATLLTVPIMLCAKPCVIGCKRSCGGSKANVDDDFEKENSAGGALNAVNSKDDDFVSASLP